MRVCLWFLIIIFLSGCGTTSFLRLSGPEKWWVVTHPFIAIPAQKITSEVIKTSHEMEKDRRLDGDPDGGTVDAFRHSYWMARLCQRFKPKKALDLGRAHEKANYRRFLKKKPGEENTVQDSIASVMDLFNNEVGAAYGKSHPSLTPDSLIRDLIQLIDSGKLKIILKSAAGQPLDCNRRIIDETEYQTYWNNSRCLVNSNEAIRHKN
jgi:hypothetical protein